MIKIIVTEYATKLARRKKLALVAAIITLFFISAQLSFFHKHSFEDVSCHYVDIGDALSPIGGTSNIPLKSMFFHETSCRGQLNSRQACSVESVAKTHPHWQINVLFSGPVTAKNLNNGSLNALKQLMNVKFFRVHLLQYVKGTPVESFVRGEAWNRSQWPIEQTSDLLRYLTLYKWGGVYLDLDQIVVKSFEDLGNNWAALESGTAVAGCPLSISKDSVGRVVAEAAISDFKTQYRGDIWGHNGPQVITRVLKEMCNTNNVSEMSADRCNGFEVYSSELFYPVRWQDARQYLGLKDLKVRDPYAHHVWNKKTAEYKVNTDSVYARLARKYCPTIHKLYGDRFGM